jgi:putative oxidoreductase
MGIIQPGPTAMPDTTQANAALLVGRILLALIFITSGVSKLGSIGEVVGYIQSAGLPGFMVWPTIAVEVLGGLAIILGFQTRIASVLLAGFTLLAALFFHRELGDQMQFIQFMKNLAITGGFLVLAVAGPGQWSLDGRRSDTPALTQTRA